MEKLNNDQKIKLTPRIVSNFRTSSGALLKKIKFWLSKNLSGALFFLKKKKSNTIFAIQFLKNSLEKISNSPEDIPKISSFDFINTGLFFISKKKIPT